MKSTSKPNSLLLTVAVGLALCAANVRAGVTTITFTIQQGNLQTNGVAYGSGSGYSGVVDGRITDDTASSALSTAATNTLGNQFRTGNGQQYLSLYSYDLTELNNFIAANNLSSNAVTIQSVSFQITSGGSVAGSSMTLGLYQTDPFTSGATWSTTDGSTAWSNPYQNIGSSAQYGYTGGASALTAGLGGSNPNTTIASGPLTWTTSTAFLGALQTALARADKKLYLTARGTFFSNSDNRLSVNFSSVGTAAFRPLLTITLQVNTSPSAWTGVSGTSWTTANNWTNGSVPTTDAQILFNSSSTANLSTVLNQNFAITNLIVTTPSGPVSIGGANSLTLDAIGGIDLSGANQNLTITAPLVLGVGQTWNVAANRTLSVNGGISGALGLTNIGPGTFVLGGNGANTNLTINGGTVNFASDGNTVGNPYPLGAYPASTTAAAVTLIGGGLLDTTTATISANRGITLGAGGGTLDASSGQALTVSSIVAGSGALTKGTNNGSLTLNAVNTYSGATAINGGTVTIAGAGQLGSGTYAGAISLAGSGTILEYSSSANQTLSGAITGTGALTKDGPTKSDLTLSSANNTYNGLTTITNGRVVVTAPGNLSGGATAIIQTNGGQLFVNISGLTFSNSINLSSTGYPEGDALVNIDGAIRDEGSTLAGPITLSGNSRIGNVTTGTTNLISGQITGAYGIDFYGMNAGNNVAHLFALSNPGNNYTGVTTIYNQDYASARTGGSTTLRLGASGVIPSGASAGNLAFNGADANHLTILDLYGFNQTINGTTVTAASSARITNSVGSASMLTIGTNNTTSIFSGVIADGGSGSANTLAITKIGSGTLTLSGANAYSGPTTNNAGTLEADNSAALGTGLLIMNGGALSNNVSATLTNNINLAVNSTVGVGTSQTLTLGGVITNTGSLTVVGAGTLSLTNLNTYSGGTVINGTVSPRNGFCFGTGTMAVNTGGQVFSSATFAQIFTNAVTLNGGQLHTGGGNANNRMTWSGPVTVTASSSMAADGGTLGNTLTGGLNMGNSGYTLTLSGNGNNGLSAHNFNSIISGGPNAAVIGSSSGLVYLNAANTFSGTNRSGYSLVLQNVNALQNATLDMNAADTGTVTLINNAVIGALTGSRNVNLSVSSVSIGNNNASTTFSGALTNTGSIIKIGSGTLTLSGANTYAGNTTVSTGTLALSGSGTLASPNITVAGGATFDVSALSSTFTLASGQKLANSGATTATLNGSADASIGKVTLAYASGTPSLKVTSGTLTLSASTTFTVSNTGSILQAGTYTNILANGGTVAAGALPSVVVTGTGAVGLPSLSIDGAGNLILTIQNTGWTGAVSTSWTTAGNWSSGTVPNPGDPINFNSSSTANLNTVMNANFSISTVTLTVPTGPVSIAAGGAYALSITNGINLASATADLTITAPVTLGASQTWNVTNTHTLNVNGGVSGSAALTISGGGKVSLGSAASYTGDTTVSAGGTLQMDAANALPNGVGVGNMYVFGTLDLNGGNAESVNAFNGGGVVDNTGGGAATLTVGNNNTSNTNFAGVIQNTSGTLSLVKTGSGGLTLSGTNTFSGGTTINSGALVPGNTNAIGTGTLTVNSGGIFYPVTSLTFTNAVTLNGGTAEVGGGNNNVLRFSGPVTVTADSALATDGGAYGISLTGGVDMGSGGYKLSSFNNNSAKGSTISGQISGANGTILNTAANGTLWITASNTFAGAFRATNGPIVFQNLYALQNATLDMNAADSGAVSFSSIASSTVILGALTGARNLNVNSSPWVVSIGNNNASTTFSGALTNSGALTKIGSGTLTLAGANTYTGRTIVSSGTLALSGSGSLASPVISVAGGATFDASAASFTLGAGQVLSNSASATANLVGPLDSGSGTISVSFVNGTPSFNVAGGTLNLSAATIVAVRNTGATLTPGTYKIISASGGGAVSGTAPTSVSVINGPTAGTPAVVIVGGELYLTVGGTSVISYTGTGPYTYSGTAQGPTNNLTGSTNTQTSAYVGVSVTYGPSVSAPTNVGTYYLSNTVTTDANYFGATNSQSFSINAAALGITANNTNKNYGQTISFAGTEFTASGLVASDSVSSVTLTSAGVTNTATVGGYAIVASAAVGTGLNNYTITYTNGTLTVNQAATSVGSSSTADPSGFKDSVAFLATLPVTATGSVIFSSTNDPISTNSVSSGSATSLSITNLPRGTNLITVAYLGDGNYLGSTNTLNQIVTNHPPVAVDATYYRAKGMPLKIALADLFTNVTDVDGDTTTLQSVGAGLTNATILTDSTYVFYLPGTGAGSNDNDVVSFTVSDGYGGESTANILINVYNANGQPQMSAPTNGVVNITFYGIPNYTYVVQTTTNLSVPWWTLSTNTAGTNGVWFFTDLNATNAQQYYRSAQP